MLIPSLSSNTESKNRLTYFFFYILCLLFCFGGPTNAWNCSILNDIILGDPNAGHIQEILHWQATTMKMMYKRIARAIRRAGIQAHPRDYLNFFCLGPHSFTLLFFRYSHPSFSPLTPSLSIYRFFDITFSCLVPPFLYLSFGRKRKE